MACRFKRASSVSPAVCTHLVTEIIQRRVLDDQSLGRNARPRRMWAQHAFASSMSILLLLFFSSDAAAFTDSRFGVATRRSLCLPIRLPRHVFPLQSQWDDDTFARSSSQPDTPTTDGVVSQPRPSSMRTIDRMEKFSRLPVWPAWNGVLIFLTSKLLGNELAAKLEDAIGGRVCPNFFVPEQTSPFIMLVHHCHTFAPWDPLRYIQKTFFPEGFPAHPHRGFVTVTYFLKGGFSHRDSMAIQQLYGAEPRHDGKHTQWLTTGAGVLHEEMFDLSSSSSSSKSAGFWQSSSQELYQLWLNVPSSRKLDPPRVDLLGGPEETPVVVEAVMGENESSKTTTLVLAGEYRGERSVAPLVSPVELFHVRMEPRSSWHHELPSNFETAIIYVRLGSVSVDGVRIPPHHTAYLSAGGSSLIVTTADENADFMFLAGEPLNEPVSAQGSMVMNSPDEINQAYGDYQLGRMGAPWDHKLSDEEWRQHVARYPSKYH